jgi:glycerophosphoryl diester phosphodiesterase
MTTSSFSSSSPPQIIGHRGALYEELENTRESFLRCADLNCHGVELDAFLLRDGNVVVFHGGETPPGDISNHVIMSEQLGGRDYSSDNTGSTRSTSIMDLTYPQVQALRFNPAYKEFACPPTNFLMKDYRIPLLKDVLLDLKKSKKNTHVKIELKGHTNDIVLPVLELVEQLDMVEQCSYSSFDHDQLRTLRKLRPDIIVTDPATVPGRQRRRQRHLYPTGALFDHGGHTNASVPADFVQRALDAGADEVHLRYDACTVQRIAAIHAAGLSSMAWFRGPVAMQADLTLRFWDVGSSRCPSSSSSSSSSSTSSTSNSAEENPQTGDDAADNVQIFLEDAACYRVVLETGVQQICVNRPDVAMAMLLLE